MKPVSPVNLVVIDDICRFALHLWSYLADVPAFGIGDFSSRDGKAKIFWAKELSADDEESEKPINRGSPSGLKTPDGRWCIWWVDARGTVWDGQLTAVLEAIGNVREATSRHPASLRFLIDVRGTANEHVASRYSFRDVLKFLRKKEISTENQDVVKLVSSYKKLVRDEDGGIARVVFEKTAATFEKIRRSVEHYIPPNDTLESPSKAQVSEHECNPDPSNLMLQSTHVLVTGAGFDLGGADPTRGLGSVSTTDLLYLALKTESPRPARDGKDSPKRQLEFPVPDHLFADLTEPEPENVDSRIWRLFIEAAEVGSLDLYWEYLLKLELERVGKGDGRRLVFDKLAAAAREQELRELFRSALSHSDWGLTRQTLDALREPRLSAWLTTNYTRFPNRALDLISSHGLLEERGARPWRILSTSNEATTHLRKLLYGEVTIPDEIQTKQDVNEGDTYGASSRDNYRYLFKVHGDLPHITTMALAASDKEIYSPLSMPIDSLHWLYSTAEKHLQNLVETSHNKTFVWHIVGHGLRDALLVDLLVRVSKATPTREHIFIIVGLNAKTANTADDPALILEQALHEAGNWTIISIEAMAQDYMARLREDRILDGEFRSQFQRWTRRYGFATRSINSQAEPDL